MADYTCCHNGASTGASIAVPLLVTCGGEPHMAADLTAIHEKAIAAPPVRTEVIPGANHFYDGHV
ncbi:MAG TPA: hypothetical protein VFU63_11220 [Ktedonobacterales bacterium]|nr:hypothetical protein [Ktedonobacterales bacterium]